MATRVQRRDAARIRQGVIDSYPGRSLRAIAARFNLSIRQARAVLEAAGVDLRPVGRPGANTDEAVRLRTLPAPSPAPPVVLSVDGAPAPVSAAPEPSPVESRASDLERKIFDFGKKPHDPRPILWRCPACHRPQHEPGSRQCVCGWLFITGNSGSPRRRRPMVPDGCDPDRSIFVDGFFGTADQW